MFKFFLSWIVIIIIIVTINENICIILSRPLCLKTSIGNKKWTGCQVCFTESDASWCSSFHILHHFVILCVKYAWHTAKIITVTVFLNNVYSTYSAAYIMFSSIKTLYFIKSAIQFSYFSISVYIMYINKTHNIWSCPMFFHRR